MWFQTCSWGGMLGKEQVEKGFCLVGHGSAVPSHLDPATKLLSSAGLQRCFAASSAQRNCDEDEKGELAVQREEAGFSWAGPSQCEADRVRQWPLTAQSWLLPEAAPQGGTAGTQPRPGKSLLAQLEEQGSQSHRLYLARGHSKFWTADLLWGLF